MRLFRKTFGKKRDCESILSPIGTKNPSDNSDSPYLFLNYSHTDRAFVDELIRALSLIGIRVAADFEFLPGQNWTAALESALDEASAGVTVWSERSVQSRWVIDEAAFFLESAKPFAQIVLGQPNIPNLFRTLPILEFRGDFPNTASQIVKQTGIVAAGRPVPPPMQNNKGVAFISYNEEDEEFVGELTEFMGDKRYNWWEYQDGDRDFSLALFRELETRIQSSEVVLCIVTPHWRESTWTIKEYFYSKKIGRPTFLLKFRDPGPTLAIEDEAYIDFTRKKSQGYKTLTRQLIKHGL